jgi:hypothetical protein
MLWHFTVTAWECVKTLPRTLVKKSPGYCIMTTHHLTFSFSPGNFLPKTIRLPSPMHPTHLTWHYATIISYPDWRYCYCPTIKVIKTELQAVLNTLTEHNFQAAEALVAVHMHGSKYFHDSQ